MSRQIPLKVVADIGGGGALARIEKGRKLMRERKSEWSQADELPVRLPYTVFSFSSDISLDRNTTAGRKPVSFDICLSCLQGTIDGAKPPNDDGVWTRCYKG